MGVMYCITNQLAELGNRRDIVGGDSKINTHTSIDARKSRGYAV